MSTSNNSVLRCSGTEERYKLFAEGLCWRDSLLLNKSVLVITLAGGVIEYSLIYYIYSLETLIFAICLMISRISFI